MQFDALLPFIFFWTLNYSKQVDKDIVYYCKKQMKITMAVLHLAQII